MKHDLVWFVALIVGLGASWLFVKWYSRRAAPTVQPPAAG
jgi:hypothetical protein